MQFYTEYMVGWMGLLSFSALAAILFIAVILLLRRAFPGAYSQRDDHDDMVIELHHGIAMIAGLSAFLAGTTPMFAVLYDAPVTPFGTLLAVMVALSATLVIVASIRVVKYAGILAANR